MHCVSLIRSNTPCPFQEECQLPARGGQRQGEGEWETVTHNLQEDASKGTATRGDPSTDSHQTLSFVLCSHLWTATPSTLMAQSQSSHIQFHCSPLNTVHYITFSVINGTSLLSRFSCLFDHRLHTRSNVPLGSGAPGRHPLTHSTLTDSYKPVSVTVKHVKAPGKDNIPLHYYPGNNNNVMDIIR